MLPCSAMRFKPASMAGRIGLAARDVFELPDRAKAGERVGPALIALGLMAIGAIAPNTGGLHVAR